MPAVIGFQRVAAGGDEIETGVEFLFGYSSIGASGGDFAVEVFGVERACAGGGEDVLAKDIPWPRSARFSVERVGADGIEGGLTLHHLEAVGGDEEGLGRGVVAVVGTADPLHEAFHVFRCADLDHQIDIAPVDSEVERAGADHGAQRPGGHRLFDAFALFAGKGAVVDADGQAVGVL